MMTLPGPMWVTISTWLSHLSSLSSSAQGLWERNNSIINETVKMEKKGKTYLLGSELQEVLGDEERIGWC